jgi:hypothetical protein
MARKRQRANGEGTVYPRKNKEGKITSYLGSYWAQTANGPKRKYVSAPTKTEALAQLRKELAGRRTRLRRREPDTRRVSGSMAQRLGKGLR